MSSNPRFALNGRGFRIIATNLIFLMPGFFIPARRNFHATGIAGRLDSRFLGWGYCGSDNSSSCCCRGFFSDLLCMCTGEGHGQRSQNYKWHYDAIESHRSILKEVKHSSEVLTPQTVYSWRDDKFSRKQLPFDSAQISKSSIHGEARWSASWVCGIEQTKNVHYFIVFSF